jgi:hypothetical protein
MWQMIKREELYEKVWSVPIWTLCQQYGLSDNGLRKVCKRLNVPVPQRGYWAKVEAGHKVGKSALPSVAVANAEDPFDSAKGPVPLWRGHGMHVRFTGLAAV